MLSQHASVGRTGEKVQHGSGNRTFGSDDMNMTALGSDTHAESKLGGSSLAQT